MRCCVRPKSVLVVASCIYLLFGSQGCILVGPIETESESSGPGSNPNTGGSGDTDAGGSGGSGDTHAGDTGDTDAGADTEPGD
jgi:hypothetical protein